MFRKKKEQEEIVQESQLLVADNPLSRASDEFRFLRTNIQYAFKEKPLKTLVVTSPNENEGKTTVAANLAATFAQERTMVLLVDANMRNPGVHEVLGIPNENGLLDLLRDKTMDLNKAIRKSQLPNLHFIPAGNKPLNPAELLNSSRMEALMDQMRMRYNLVIFDTPAILVGTDAQLLAAKSDTTLLVYDPKGTSTDELKVVSTLFENVNAHVIGTICNNIL